MTALTNAQRPFVGARAAMRTAAYAMRDGVCDLVKHLEAHRAHVINKMGIQSLPDLLRIVLQCEGSGGLFPDAD